MNERLNAAGFSAILLLSLWTLPARATEVCRRETLQIAPKWISTLEFDRSVNQILVADPKERQLLSVNVKNWNVRPVRVEGVSPALVTRIAGGYWVQSETNAAIMGPGIKSRVVALEDARTGAGTTLRTLYANWVTRGYTFLGFGSVSGAGVDLQQSPQSPARRFQLGFVRGSVRVGTGRFENVEVIEPSDRNAYYVTGLQYFAANNTGLFYVRMDEEAGASILRVGESGKPQEISAFPAEFRKVQSLEKDGESVEAIYATIESRSMAYGLFGQGDFLYLLTRQPHSDGGGGTEWLLHKIDPVAQKLMGKVRLPTRASHLSVAVGTQEWYFIERGTVRGWGDQDIKTAIRVPRSWIDSPADSPIEASKTTARSCISRR